MRNVLLLFAALAACSTVTPKETSVQFLVLSPFCGPNSYSIRFSIDSVLVGTDTLKDKESSPRFVTTPGGHRLNARVTAAPFTGLTMDTLVTVPADTVFTQVFDIYCS